MGEDSESTSRKVGEFTPAEQWTRYDEDCELLRVLHVRANERNPDASYFEVAHRVLSRRIAKPTCPRPEPERHGGVDLAEARAAVDKVGTYPLPAETRILRALCDEVETLRGRVAELEGDEA